eukprot:CAMPEP_0170547530 /NCGR_PEP_ID=MMETSP0211-20121228/5942_1 /TAXON_ID=311385 /ORGANISM="Pseudokeronopsis sp., Strain OXSARD2" /LENGTH=94 /DNA_ID=CAMNT_0010852643 /DNA_START=254 /DNA_END=538 /DNA_ORIENTATION=+
MAFICYRNPQWFAYFFKDLPEFSIPFLACSIIAFNLASYYLESMSENEDKKHAKIREKLKDMKRNLISHMDPLVLETLKEIVKKDLKEEIQVLR